MGFKIYYKQGNLCSFIVLTLMILSGCASESNRGARVANDADVAKSTLVQAPLPTLPLVVIRYPASARLDDNHRADLYAAYRQVWPGATDDQIEHALSEELSKTQYYVMEFYRVLSTRLPRGTILLSPAILDTDLKLKDIVAPPPHVLQVDMSVTVNWNRVISQNYFGADTSGNKVSPVIQVLFKDLSSVDTIEYKKQFAAAIASDDGMNRLPDADVVLASWQRDYSANPEVYKQKLLPALERAKGVALENGIFFGFSGNPAQGWWVPERDLRRQLQPTCCDDQKMLPTEGMWQAYSEAIVDVSKYG